MGVVSLLIIKKVRSKTEKMDFPKLVKENEDLKSQVKSISEKFNAYIMRDKEFQDLRREMEFYRHELEKYKAKNQSHEMTIKYLRKQLLKKDRQVDAQKKAVTFLRGQSSSTTPNTSTSCDTFD